MFRVLVADDSSEDRELLKLEIGRALEALESDVRFYEAVSVAQAQERLKNQPVDLMTLDIEFDRLNEGIEALPDFFEEYPALNIIVISGKLSKSEVMEELFRFTKENVLKGKRWARHFDVLDKKDDKTGALRSAYSFAVEQRGAADKVHDLFLLAEGYLEQDEVDKCLHVYEKIQTLAPGERESKENIGLFKEASYEKALEYYRRGERVVGSLLMGYHIERRLKSFTRKALGRYLPGLYDCLKELERARKVGSYKKSLFQQLLRLRNKAVHHPASFSEQDFEKAQSDLRLLEASF
jgi:CheY-like chemotaxis protein